MKILRNISKLSKGKLLQISLICALAFLLLIWVFILSPYFEKISEEFRYESSIISTDNLYDEEKGEYSGEISSNTQFYYQFIGEEDDTYIISNVFEVKTPGGEPIFSVERLYGINPLTGEHVSGYGDKDRSGYLFAPKNLNKETYTYWHVNYDIPAEMNFVAEENILGLKAYKYVSTFTVDQSENLGHLPGVGETRGISVDAVLFVWIEPLSGNLIKYEDSAVAYYYDLKSGERISPWNKFSNRYTTSSIAEHVHIASSEKIRLMIYEQFIPGLLLLILLGFFLSFTIKQGRNRVFQNFTPIVFLSVSLIATFSIWLAVSSIINRQVNTLFETETSEIENSLETKMEIYANLLRSGRGLFNASANVTEFEWNEFTDGLRLQKNYPGVQDFGFVFKDESSGIYTNNIYYEEEIRAAIEENNFNETLTISGRVNFIAADETKSGFLMYLPVYKQNEPDSILGYVYGLFFIDNFIRSSLNISDFNVDFEIYDSEPEVELNEENKFFDSNPSHLHSHTNLENRLRKIKNLNIYNSNWSIEFLAPLGYEKHGTQALIPSIFLISGLVLSFLIFTSTYLLSSSRLRAINMADEITKDLRLEKLQLVSANAKDEAILRSMADGVIAVNKSGKILFMNKAAGNFLQLNPRDCSGKNIIKLIKMTYENGKKVPDSKRPTKLVLSGKENGMTGSKNYYFSKKDGTRFPVSFSIAPIMVEGKLTGAIDIFRDISKESEIDKAKTEFVSLASHQLRTPLTAIKWYSEELLSNAQKNLSKEQNEQLKQIKVSNDRMVDLVDTLLNVSRIEMGTLKLDVERIKITTIIESIVQELSSTIKGKQIKLEENFAKNIPTIRSDSKVLRMIFQNLIANAVKYTPNKGVVKLELELSKDKKSVLIRISDTGYGIPKKQQGKIFGKLFRADNATEKVTDGTGLGLYIVKGAVEKLGGKVWFESVENKGSTFYFTLPIKKS